MVSIRVALKFIGFSSLVMAYLSTSMPLYLWGLTDRYGARQWMAKACSFYAKLTLHLLGIEYKTLNSAPHKNQGTMVVSNHLSYIDVLVMAAINPSLFVTSVEIKNTPFLGQLCEAGGCLYVERRNKRNIGEEIKDITRAMERGLDVVIFPEATSTNGEEVKHFKRPLFKAAIDANVNIITSTINYTTIDDDPVTLKNRDDIFWYGDMSFLPHFLTVLSHKKIKCSMTYGEVVTPSEESTTTQLAEMAHYLVSSNYQSVHSTF